MFVIFMLSENYYHSYNCLNEMGAVWVQQSNYQSILLSGFDYKEVAGAIDPRKISFKLDDCRNRNSALGELKNNIMNFLEITDYDESVWDYQRTRFFEKIDELYTKK